MHALLSDLRQQTNDVFSHKSIISFSAISMACGMNMFQFSFPLSPMCVLCFQQFSTLIPMSYCPISTVSHVYFILSLFPVFSDKSLFPLLSDKSPPSSPNQVPLPSALTNESHKTTYQTSCKTRGWQMVYFFIRAA